YGAIMMSFSENNSLLPGKIRNTGINIYLTSPYKGEFISSYSLSCRYLFQFVTINMAKILQQTAVKKFGEDFL
ncbi:hypothetical protein EBJ38_16665, partial [Escherichia coli]|nr:hypothetical protein [Escherichia coli]